MKKKRKGLSSRIAMGIILGIIGFISFLIFTRTRDLNMTLKAQQEELAGINLKIERAEDETEDIRDEIKYRETDDYIEDQARESLGLRYPDEIILRPEDSEK